MAQSTGGSLPRAAALVGLACVLVSGIVGWAARWWLPVAAGWCLATLMLALSARAYRERGEEVRSKQVLTLTVFVGVIAFALSVVAAVYARGSGPANLQVQRWFALVLPVLTVLDSVLIFRRHSRGLDQSQNGG